MSEYTTVVDYGADPSGSNDSSDAFRAMADDSSVSVVVVPDGDFVIASTVDLNRKSMRGCGRNRNGEDHGSRVRHSSGLNGPMFINQGAVVSDLYIAGSGESQGKLAFQAIGYNSLFNNIHFHRIGTAIDVEEITVNFSIVDCVFIMVGIGIRCHDVNNDTSTTTRLVRNEFNNCGNAFVYDRKVTGSSFIDNIFEFLSGDAVVASHIYNTQFIGNWWEKRRPDGTESPFGNAGESEDNPGYPPIRTIEYQQIMRCFATGNSMSYGWRDDFSTEEHDNKMGGVSTNGGEVVVRSSTGRAIRITSDGISKSASPDSGLGPFIIDAGYNSTGRPGMTLRTHRGPLRVENDEDEAFGGALTFSKGNGLEERYTLTKNLRGELTAGMTGVSEININGETVNAITGIPQHFLWRQDNLARGLDCFTTNEVSNDGEIRLRTPYVMDNPILQITVEDRGVQFDGWDYIDSYVNNSNSRRQCEGFVLYFVDRQGNPITPTAFMMQLLTLEPSIT